MLKNTKFYVALALIVQAIASVVAGILSAAKKRTFSTIAFFAIGGVSGAAGAYLMAECAEEEADFEEYCDGDCENCAEFEECEALEAEEAEEAEEVEEEADFELDGGEAFARVAEAKDID